MTMSLDRRTFTKTLTLGLAGAAVTPLGAQKTRRLKVGHTGITWGFTPADAERAIADASSLTTAIALNAMPVLCGGMALLLGAKFLREAFARTL